MSITDWPKQERPREKLIQRGPAALSDAELLAIFCVPGFRVKPQWIWRVICWCGLAVYAAC